MVDADERAMVNAGTVSWGLSISDTDFEKLKIGFHPVDMDDKWVVSAADSDSSGKISITFGRSWTGQKIYILAIKPSIGGSGVKIEAITWEQTKGRIHISEEYGKIEAVLLCRGLLGCEIDALPNYDASFLRNYHAAMISTNRVSSVSPIDILIRNQPSPINVRLVFEDCYCRAFSRHMFMRVYIPLMQIVD